MHHCKRTYLKGIQLKRETHQHEIYDANSKMIKYTILSLPKHTNARAKIRDRLRDGAF